MLTDDEIRDALETEFLGDEDKKNLAHDMRVARAIIAAHNAKLLAGVEIPDFDGQVTRGTARMYKLEDRVDGRVVYTYETLQQYATAAAAQARVKALDEAKVLCEEKYATRSATGFIREASTARALAGEIEQLKVKP